MDDELIEELDLLKESLVKSGFFDEEEILEIMEEQFIDEDGIDFDSIEISLIDASNSNFQLLEDAFAALAKRQIIAIHNCGYDMEEGVNDAFELLVHLQNNKHSAKGFCFYTFEDIEDAIFEGNLKITFGDFEGDRSRALEIGKTVREVLESFNFNVKWNETIDERIEINPFVWDKRFNPDRQYEMEGAFDVFVENQE